MKRPAKKQLYAKVKEISLPENLLHVRGSGGFTYQVSYQKIPTAAFVSWPSGKPCLAVNMYLLDKSWKYTGDSVVIAASKLSELIRYCAGGRVNCEPCAFGELNDGDIARLIDKLCSDCYIDQPTERLRNNNSVRAIMQTIFDFLFWYDQNLNFNKSKLIGTRSEGASIVVKRALNPHSNRYYFSHRYLPPRVLTDPKLPIATKMIESILAVISELENPDSYPAAALRRFSDNKLMLKNYLDFITARREFMVFLMRTAGLRPSEMSEMSAERNSKSVRVLDKPSLLLPTKKRRQNVAPLRKFQITSKQAIRVLAYLAHRTKWLNYCKSLNTELPETDSMFLSAEPGKFGTGVAITALHKDFKMLCDRAGYSKTQACFSMFRHRFITDLVSMHLKMFRSKKGELNKQDYRTLLEKVREKTGHASINSLWHYIDLESDLPGVWAPVESEIETLQESEQSDYDLLKLRREVESGPDKIPKEDLLARLDRISGRSI